jgi:hypothetical protein
VDTCSLSQLLPPNLVRLIDRLHPEATTALECRGCLPAFL